jgi:hypothetical protein
MRRALALALPLLLSTSALADRIHFKHGDYVDVDAWREEGDRILYQRFGGEIGVPKSDVLRIERRQTDPTRWQAPGSSSNPSAPYASASGQASGPTAASTGSSGSSLVEIRSIQTRITEQNTTFVRWAWRLELTNRAGRPIVCSAEIEFQDSDGFPVSSDYEGSLALNADETRTSTGSHLVRSDSARKVSKAVAKVRVRP